MCLREGRRLSAALLLPTQEGNLGSSWEWLASAISGLIAKPFYEGLKGKDDKKFGWNSEWERAF